MIQSKLPDLAVTIFTRMSQLAAQTGALNLSQGFPDFDGPAELLAAVGRHVAAGHNQYAPMTGLPALRQQVAAKVAAFYGREVDAETEGQHHELREELDRRQAIRDAPAEETAEETGERAVRES